MSHLSGLRLFVSDPAQLAQFYAMHLGMEAREVPEGWRVGYPGADADVLLMPGGVAYWHATTDRYWKIGVTLPDVDVAHARLSAAGIEVSTPHQFRDIGYMCHLRDPEGFGIELLQHHFDGNRPDDSGDPAQPLGGGARVGQITLRTGDIDATQITCDRLGMRLLSVQPVREPDFDLYFWAFTSETPPDDDLYAVENREWLWQRPYTTLEFQHVEGLKPTVNTGYAGIEIDGKPADAFKGQQADNRP